MESPWELAGIGFLFVVLAALFFGIYKMKAPAVAVEGGKLQRVESGTKPKEPPQREESGRLTRQLTASGRGPFKHDPAVPLAANKRFEVLKFKFKFPRARTFELYRARSIEARFCK